MKTLARTTSESYCPPLRNGDRLTRAEFERRYDAMPNLKGAELVEGKVYMSSPVRHDEHSKPHLMLAGWLQNFIASADDLEAGDNGTVRLDLENEPQPDLYLMLPPKLGGNAHIDGDGYVSGAPEFVAEIAASSVSYDLHDKLNAYRRNGVLEYLVWRVEDQEIDWFLLKSGNYVPLEADDGILKSPTFPGLWLDAKAMIAGKLAKVNKVLQQGLKSPAHSAFLAKIKKAKSK